MVKIQVPKIGRIAWQWAGLPLLVVAWSTAASADQIVLRGGGSIQGVILPEASGSDEEEAPVRVLTRASPRPLNFRPGQILKVIPEQDELREYLERRDEPRTTGEQEYQFALWCEDNGLPGPAEIHFREAVALDPEHAEARKKIGHVLFNGEWMTYSEMRERQGLVQHKGRWISQQEKEEIDEQEVFSSEQREWSRRLKGLRRQWLSDELPHQQAAELQLRSIRDPAAVLPLLRTFGADPEPIRARLAELIAPIPGPEAAVALARLVLNEPSPAVREATLAQLQNRQDADTAPRLSQALGSDDPTIVGRAAWALAALGEIDAVPKLIPKLIKVQKRLIFEAQPTRPRGGVAFSSLGPGPFVNPGGYAGYAVPGGASGPVWPAYVGGGVSIPILTGPAVGPGAVAYGATSIPFGALGAGMVSEGANPNRPVVRVQTDVYRNTEVLRALVQLTGQDFGFDTDAWKRWLRAEFRPQPAPVREVPQP